MINNFFKYYFNKDKYFNYMFTILSLLLIFAVMFSKPILLLIYIIILTILNMFNITYEYKKFKKSKKC